MKSYIAKPAEVERKWYVVDAEGKTLGRLASEVASVLRGKNKPTYTPHVDCGDYVIVINAEKVEVTGKKRKEKIYKRHTGYDHRGQYAGKCAVAAGRISCGDGELPLAAGAGAGDYPH